MTGTWTARAVSAKADKKGANKTPCVTVALKITEGTFEGEKVYSDLWLTEKPFDRSIESLRNLGWKGDDLRDLSTVNGECEVVLEEEEYNGKVQTKVKWINALGGGKPKLEATELGTLADSLKSRIQASDRARSAGAGRTPF
jgi:hypothetical protein